MYRESLILWIGAAAALVGYLIHTEAPPTEWNYGEWLGVASFVLAWAMGKLAHSPLKGKPDEASVSPTRLTCWLLPLLLVGGLSLGCASVPAVVSPNPAADQVAATRAQALQLATSLTAATDIAIEVVATAQRIHEAGGIDYPTIQRINQAGIIAGQQVQAFARFAESVTTEMSLRTTVGELLRVFDDLIAAAIAGDQNGAAIHAALAVLRAYLGIQE